MNSSTETIVVEDVQDSPNNNSVLKMVDEKEDEKISWSTRNKNTLIHFVIFVSLTTYFLFATNHYFGKEDSSIKTFRNSMCDGYGFLLIIYCFYLYGVIYTFLLKPKLFPIINKILWKPAIEQLESVKYGVVIFYISLLVATIAYLIIDTQDNRKRLIPISGLAAFLLIAYAMSNNRSEINWRTVLWGIILQFLFGILTIRWEVGRNVLDCFGQKVNILLHYAIEGAEFTFGQLLVSKELVFAFRALSSIYFISFLVNILYYYGIMQKLVGSIGEFLQWIMGTSICESVNSAANIFLGLTEAPILLSPYLKDLTDSELHSIMTSGFATVAGSVMAAYIGFGARAQDLITASIMSAPAALCFSKMVYPETEKVRVHKKNIHEVEHAYASVLDAASRGAINGIEMVHGIVASVIAFLASIYLINGVLGWLGVLVGFTDEASIWSLEFISGKIFIPISYIMGVPWDECQNVGTLIGVKTMVNEFVAFQRMKTMIEEGLLSPRTRVIATYALCGFANPGSIGITISGLGTLVPNKKEAVTRLVFRAFIGGSLACFMTACIAGCLMPDDALI